ncbi:DegV family protein [Ornithinimicrobium panacihumi]|uniref:DegV family protein n=1 Tax=Ornithinimicrobium panacihumi TaxID=2008449 RepID=UPI003F8B5FC9
MTDTTAALTAEQALAAGVTIVPLHVTVTGRRSVESRQITPGEVAEILAEGKERVSTSMPSPGELARTYRQEAADGAQTLVSVHLSSKVSGTVEAAEIARDSVAEEIRVEVVDSAVLGLAMGYAVLAGSRVAASGGTAEEVVETVRAHAAASRTWFYVDTLEHLRRGGRIGLASALLGSALAIKPLLTVKDGAVAPAEKVRTKAKALARLVERGVEAVEEARAEGLEVKVAVLQLAAEESAAQVAGELAERTGIEPDVAEVDPIVGVHVGPGTVGVVVAPQPR